MLKRNYRRSPFTKGLWLGMAVFFVVFCSCPVKKYIRMHLYKQVPLVERTAGDHMAPGDVKDCSIAERHQQVAEVVFTFLPPPPVHDLVPFFLPSFISCTGIGYPKIAAGSRGVPVYYDRIRVPIPLYLWVRHLQV